MFKEDITHWAQSRAKQIAYQKTCKLKSLEEKVKKLEEEITIYPMHCDIPIKLELAKHQLETHIVEKTQSAIFRSKAKYVAENETNSKYFLTLEKHNYNKKVMTVIKTDDGGLIQDPNKILKEQYNFYSKLYTKKPSIKFSLENNTGKN